MYVGTGPGVQLRPADQLQQPHQQHYGTSDTLTRVEVEKPNNVFVFDAHIENGQQSSNPTLDALKKNWEDKILHGRGCLVLERDRDKYSQIFFTRDQDFSVEWSEKAGNVKYYYSESYGRCSIHGRLRFLNLQP